MTSLDCHFCRKLANLDELPVDELVWQFPHSVALLGRSQYYAGYCLLVARRHATELSRLSDLERRAYLDEMCLLARAIEECFRPKKLNYELLGNQVPHLHWHLFPRYEHDPDHLRPVWLALDRAERDESLRRRLETGPQDRRETIGTLQRKLEELAGSESKVQSPKSDFGPWTLDFDEEYPK
jgi:diadenosine tetraphosphate (Ap4A) HIT family hydrolase